MVDAGLKCRVAECAESPERGFVLCATHEQAWKASPGDWEPESRERDLVRGIYAEDCLLPYRPASLEPKPRVRRVDDRPPIDKVLSALASAGCSYRPAPNDVDSWQAACPAHEDRSPSLHVSRRYDGVIGLRCWAGCDTEAVLRALGLEWRDLWHASEQDHGRLKGPPVKPLLPSHLRHAMQDLLRRDEERRAAV